MIAGCATDLPQDITVGQVADPLHGLRAHWLTTTEEQYSWKSVNRATVATLQNQENKWKRALQYVRGDILVRL